MNMKVQALAIMLLATAHGGAYATTGVTTSGTEITVCVEAGETLAMPPIGASVTKVVKTGGGEAQFTPAGITNTFTAALEIQAGTLSGHRASFGKSSLITVVPGATLKLAGWDASAQWTQDTTSTIGAGKARIGGSGVGGAGALVRTFRYYPDGTLCLFTDLTLTDDTLMDTGGGLVGFLRDGMFDMGTHALTLTGSGRFDMTKGQVKNLGDIRSLSTQIYLEKNAVAYDANPAGKQIVLDGGSARADNAHDNWNPIPYGFHVKGDAVLDLTNGDGSHVNYDSFTGPVDIGSGKRLQLKTARKWGVPKNVTFSGKIDSEGTLSLTGPGTFWITGRANSALGNIEMTNDARRIVCANIGHATVSNVCLCGTTKSGEDVARLVVTGDTALVGSAFEVRQSHYIRLGENANQFGILEMFPGAAITNNLYNTRGYGALYQHGGTFRSPATSGNDMVLAVNYDTYQYVLIEDGEFSYHDYFHIAKLYARGIMDQRGGMFRTSSSDGTFNGTGNLYFGGGTCKTHFRQSGGTCEVGYLGINHHNLGSSGNNAFVTVTGSNTMMSARVVRLNVSAGNTGANNVCVNLNDGGMLTVGQIGKSTGWDGALSAPANTPNCRVFVNFNGGVLRASGAYDYIFGNADGTSGAEPERVTVYEKGATVDTQGHTIHWTRPFLAPTGRRIKRITITDSTLLQANYGIGPGIVRIESSSGAGASAFAIFDSTNRQLSAEVEVTSGGWDYEASPTVAIETPTDVNATVACTVETETAPTTGGLTKSGAGTMKLWGVNTYGGATRLEGGTLEFIDANGYPGGDLEIPAATAASLAVNATPLMTASNLVFSAGKGVRVTEADTLDATTFGSMKTIARLSSPFAGVPSLALVNADGTTVAQNGVWQLQLADGGRTLKFGPVKGTVLIIR